MLETQASALCAKRSGTICIVSKYTFTNDCQARFLPLCARFAHLDLHPAVHTAKMELFFATLTPANVLAKLAFSDVFDALMAGRQNAQADGIPVVHRMAVEPHQEYHPDVPRLRRETERRLEQQAHEGSTSESLTEPDTDTDTEEEIRYLGMIWFGRFVKSQVVCRHHTRMSSFHSDAARPGRHFLGSSFLLVALL
jgi:hypothetical protein